MGRIEQAMRRSAAGDTQAGAPPAGPSAAFADPWTFGHAGETSPPSEPSPPAEPKAEPGAQTSMLREEAAPAAVEALSDEWRDRIVTSNAVGPPFVEQFRSLAATLHRLQTGKTLKVLMVTSAEPGEGKTLTALNLALTLSESYRQRVLLIDADLRHPSIREILALRDLPGLSEGLKARTEQKLTVLRMTQTLTILPAGRPDSDPMSGLTSPRMRRIIEEAVACFDWVILDAPPVGPVADASLLAAMTDGTLLVVRSGRTPYTAVRKAIDGVGRDRILGVVLNDTAEADTNDYPDYYCQVSRSVS